MNLFKYGFFDELMKLATPKWMVERYKRPGVGKYWRHGFDPEAYSKFFAMRRAAREGRERHGPLDPSADPMLSPRGRPITSLKGLEDEIRKGYHNSWINDGRVVEFPYVPGEKFVHLHNNLWGYIDGGKRKQRDVPFLSDRSKADIGQAATRAARAEAEKSREKLHKHLGTENQIPNKLLEHLVKKYGNERDFKELMRGHDAYRAVMLPYSAPVMAARIAAIQKSRARSFKRRSERDAWQVAEDAQDLRKYKRAIETGAATKLPKGVNWHEYKDYRNSAPGDRYGPPEPPVDPSNFDPNFWKNVKMSPDVVEGRHLNEPHHIADPRYRQAHDEMLANMRNWVGQTAGYNPDNLREAVNTRRELSPDSFWDKRGNPVFTEESHPHLSPHLTNVETSRRVASPVVTEYDGSIVPPEKPLDAFFAAGGGLDPTKLKPNAPGTFERWLASQGSPKGPKDTTRDIAIRKYQ